MFVFSCCAGHYEELKRSGIDIEAYVPSAPNAEAAEPSLDNKIPSPQSTPGSASTLVRKTPLLPPTPPVVTVAADSSVVVSSQDSTEAPHTMSGDSQVTVGQLIPVPVPAAVGGKVGMTSLNVEHEMNKEDPSVDTPNRRLQGKTFFINYTPNVVKVLHLYGCLFSFLLSQFFM